MGPFWTSISRNCALPDFAKGVKPRVVLFDLRVRCAPRPGAWRLVSRPSVFVGLVQGHRRALLHHAGLVLEKRAFNT
jgi:hypothetical protein